MKQCYLFIILLILINAYGVVAFYENDSTYTDMAKLIDEYDMIIIAPNDFSNAIHPLIDHKNSHNIETFLKTTEEIYNEYEGRDKAEQIKFFIKDAYQTLNISYVFLIGNIELIPMRMAAVKWYESDNQTLIVPDIITDVYYADIFYENMSFCSWDSNNNNIFGEAEFFTVDTGDAGYKIDDVDLHPDVGVGRVLCANKRQVKTVVEKIISYESRTYNQEWFNHMLLIGGDQYVQSPQWDPNKIMEGEIVIDQISEIMADFTHTKLCTSDETFSSRAMNKEINNGVGFIAYSGHGFEYGLGLHPPEDEYLIKYYSPFLFGLWNNNKYPIVFFHACLTTKTDYSFYNIKLPCFAWSMVKKPYSGAIAVIGSTRSGYSYTTESGAQEGGSKLMVEFFNHYEQGSILSDVFNNASKEYLKQVWEEVDDCITIEEYNLIGDPSLKIGGYP